MWEHTAGFPDQTTEPADDGRQSRIQRAHHEDRTGRDRTVGVVDDRTDGSAATCAPAAEATSAGSLLLRHYLAALAEVELVRYRRRVRFGGARREVGGSAPPPPTIASSSARVRWAMQDSGSREASINRRSNSAATRAVSSCTRRHHSRSASV